MTKAMYLYRLLICWSRYGETLRSSKPDLFSDLHQAQQALSACHGDAWRRKAPFLYVTSLSLRILQAASQLQGQRGSDIADRLLDECGGAEHCSATTRSNVQHLIAFIDMLNHRCGEFPIGFYYSAADCELLPVVALLCTAPQPTRPEHASESIDGLLCRVAERDSIVFRRTEAAARSDVPVQQQKQDALLVAALLNCSPALKERVRNSIGYGDSAAACRTELGRLLVLKHKANDTVKALWQPLTGVLKRSLQARARSDPRDKTLQWIEQQRSDRFVATIADGSGPHVEFRTILLHALMLRDASDANSAVPSLAQFQH